MGLMYENLYVVVIGALLYTFTLSHVTIYNSYMCHEVKRIKYRYP